MKVIVFGVGRQGERILELLVSTDKYEVSVFDKSVRRLKYIEKKYENSVEVLNNVPELKTPDFNSFLKPFDIIVDALPSVHSYGLMKKVVESGKKMVSVSYLEEDFMKFDGDAKSKGALIIPDCGAAPGLSHLLAGYSAKRLKNPKSVIMKVGAIPKEPVPPFNHNITWSAFDLIQEYIRDAKIKNNGKFVNIRPLSKIFKEKVLEMELESFYTDGVRSFFTSFPEIPEVEERTLRYKGHLDFMKALEVTGFLTNERIETDNFDLIPSEFLAYLFENRFKKLPEEDIFLMEILVSSDGKKEIHTYLMEYDNENRVSALVNSVAITAFVMIEMIANGEITEKGVFPLEKLANDDIYKKMIKTHEDLGAKYRFEIKNEEG